MREKKSRRCERLPGRARVREAYDVSPAAWYFSKRACLRNFPLRKRVTTRAITSWILLSLRKEARVYAEARASPGSSGPRVQKYNTMKYQQNEKSCTTRTVYARRAISLSSSLDGRALALALKKLIL